MKFLENITEKMEIDENSIEKIKDEFLWKPHKTIRDILDDVFEFYIDSKKKPVYDICIEQIERYIDCL